MAWPPVVSPSVVKTGVPTKARILSCTTFAACQAHYRSGHDLGTTENELTERVSTPSLSNMCMMVLEIPFGNFLTRGEPDVVELFDVGEEVTQRADAEGLANDMGV